MNGAGKRLEEVELAVGTRPEAVALPVIPNMLKIYDPIGIVDVSPSVSSPEGPVVISANVVMYGPEKVATVVIVEGPEGPVVV